MRSAFALLTIFLLGVCPLAQAVVHLVAQDGSGDFTTIQAAATVAVAGDTVLIRAGIYPEQVEPLNSGTPENFITYQHYTDEEVVIDGEAGTRQACIKVRNCSYLRFSGLQLRGALHAGFYAEGPANHLILDGLRSENNIHPERGAGYGIWFMAFEAPIHDCVIQHCEVHHNSSHGIFLYRRNHDILIDNNHVSYSGWESDHWGHNVKAVVWNQHDPSTGPVGITITNNNLEHAHAQGIMTWNAREVLIRGNHCHYNGATGIQIENGTECFVVEENLCEWNQQSYNTEAGIWVDDATNGIIRRNVIRHNQVGIKVSKCAGIIVRHNLIYQNDRDNPEHTHNGGIFLLAYDGVDNRNTCIVHNTLHRIGNPDYWNVALGFYEYYGAQIEGVQFQNNIVAETVAGRELEVICDAQGVPLNSDYNNFHNSDELEFYWFGEALAWEQYRAVSGQDAHSITSAPIFVDPSAHDYRLQEGSPCRDQGEFVTQTVGSGSGLMIPLLDARFFTDGFGISAGDTIRIGAQVPIQVVGVDYAAGLITVDRDLAWNDGDGVTYAYCGSAPDLGALEYMIDPADVPPDEDPGLVGRLFLGPAIPNPSTGKAQIVYATGPEVAQLAIYDAAGRLVCPLQQSVISPVGQRAFWRGRDARGRQAPCGIYYVLLSSGGEHRMRPLVVIR